MASRLMDQDFNKLRVTKLNCIELGVGKFKA